MRKILMALVLFGANVLLGSELGLYEPGYVINPATSRADGALTVLTPVAGSVFLNGSMLSASWSDSSNKIQDRDVVLIGNSGSTGKYVFVPGFSGFYDKSATSTGAIVVDQILLDSLAQYLPGAIPNGYFVEIRGEVTDNHTLTGNAVSAVIVGRSGFFSLMKEITFGTTFDPLSGTVSPMAGAEGSWMGGFHLNPVPSSSVSVSAMVNWGDGTATENLAFGGSAGNYTFSLKHTFIVGGTYTVTVTVWVNGNPNAVSYTITVKRGKLVLEIDQDSGDIVYWGETPGFKIKASRFNTRTGRLNISLSGIGK